MKRIIATLLAAALMTATAACGNVGGADSAASGAETPAA